MTTFLKRYPSRGLFSLLLVYIIWGSTYLGIRYAVREGSGFPPFSMAALRSIAGGIILLSLALARRERICISLRELGLLSLSAVLLWNGGNGLVTWAEQRAASAFAALVVGATPLYSAIVEAIFERKRPSTALVLSLILGMFGLYILTQPALAEGTQADVWATIALLLAPLSWSVGSSIQRRNPLKLSTLSISGYQQLLGTLGFVLLLTATDEPRPQPTPDAWWAWGYLVLFGSVVGFTAFVHALHTLPTPVVMTYGYVNPVIAIFLGWLFLGEAITPHTVVGTAFILAGVAGVFRQNYG
ncbi:MAG: EamA family transporter [Kiritimatiellae bacterium]|nr:EamA family transporter [Kiritimatiellia bacterium]